MVYGKSVYLSLRFLGMELGQIYVDEYASTRGSAVVSVSGVYCEWEVFFLLPHDDMSSSTTSMHKHALILIVDFFIVIRRNMCDVSLFS